MLELDFTKRLLDSEHVLFAGAGGGYDVFGAVPLAELLAQQGKRVSFANVSFSRLELLANVTAQEGFPNLFLVPAAAATADAYCPEAWLAAWLHAAGLNGTGVWGFHKSGVVPLRYAYEHLVEAHQIDAIVLVDGGIDLILRGDESSLGTPAEDLCSLAAVASLRGVDSYAACLGFGAELRDGIRHEQALNRVAELTSQGGFLGAVSLAGSAAASATYGDLLKFVGAGQATQRGSHVHSIVSRSLAGEYGEQGEHVWLSPLLNLYWFFDLQCLARSHLFLDAIAQTEHIGQLAPIIEGCRKALSIRRRSDIPI